MMHFATDYSTGYQSVPTACGKTASTWNDEPDRATMNEPDVTCHACLRYLVASLRLKLDESANRCIELQHDKLAGKIPGLGVHSNERKAMDTVVEAARAECAKFRFPDEDRPELYSALHALDVIRAEKRGE